MNDWRLQGQDRYLRGVALARKRYQRYRTGWEHDHCEFCGDKFSEDSDDLSIGYVTTDSKHWVCETCFKDFVREFQWITLPSEVD